jgi:uncharacterized membrane protein
LVASGSVINKKAGDKLTVNVTFSYQGPGGYSDTLYVALYRKTLGVVDELGGGTAEMVFTVNDVADIAIVKSASAVITIPSDAAGNTYGLYAKLEKAGKYSTYLDNVVVVASKESVISNVAIVSYT